MSFTLKQIPGAVISKFPVTELLGSDYNKAIEQQSSIPLEFCGRGKLAMALHAQERKLLGFGYEWENERAVVKAQWLEFADAILLDMNQNPGEYIKVVQAVKEGEKT